MHGLERGRIISLLQSIVLLLQIVIPVLSGALITYTGGYDYTFLLGTFILIGSVFIPYSFNKKAKSKISSDEIVRVLKKKGIGIYSVLSIIQSAFNSLFAVLFMIIPYILIGEEFGVGALSSTIGFAAVLVAWLDSKPSFKVRIQLGYIGFIIYTIFTMFLAAVWTIPSLVIRSLALAFTQSVSAPALVDIDYRIREKILGEFQNESALEMNLIAETLYIFGRVIILGFVILFFSISNSNPEATPEELIRFLIGFLAPIHIIIFMAYDILNRRLRIH